MNKTQYGSDLAIVIVNWNGGELLMECLKSIETGRQGLKLQVIVVDNASRDGSREMAQKLFPDYTIINSGANLGFGKGCNLARKYADAPLILFLNPDTRVLENSLRPMVEFMREHPDVGALGCKMRYPDLTVQEQGLQYHPTPWKEFWHMLLISSQSSGRLKRYLPYLDPEKSGYVIKLYGGCIMAPKDVLDQVGWFDERYFMYAEDVDLCRAVAAAGHKLYYLSSAEIIHVAGGVSRKAASGFSILMKCESIRLYMAKYHGSIGSFLYRIAVLTASFLRIGMLAVLKLAAAVFPRRDSFDFSNSFAKYWFMIQWSLGLRKAIVSK